MRDDDPRVGPVEWVARTSPGPVLDVRVVPPIRDLVRAGTVRLLRLTPRHGMLTDTTAHRTTAAEAVLRRPSAALPVIATGGPDAPDPDLAIVTP